MKPAHKSSVVIKITNKKLHESNKTNYSTRSRVKENIIAEAQILKFLTENNCPHIVSFIDFFDDAENLFLIMEDGGVSLFHYVTHNHQKIKTNKLQIKDWQNVCKFLFKQMCEGIHFLHNQVHVCHLDVSLENTLVNSKGIKYCDFGLAERFDGNKVNGFLCNKYVGKIVYMSPEVYAKRLYFDARKNDVWCLGICFFTMIMGGHVLQKPSPKDEKFQWIISGKIKQLITGWGKLNYVDDQIIDVFVNVFKNEAQRCNINQLMQLAIFK